MPAARRKPSSRSAPRRRSASAKGGRKAATGPLAKIWRGLRRLLLVQILLVVGAGIGYGWYRYQDRPTQERTEAVVLAGLDWVRENRILSRDTVLLLDFLADRIPLQTGPVIPSGNFSGKNRYTYAGLPRSSLPGIRILQNDAYLVGYDEQHHNPAWVAYYLSPPASRDTPPPRPENFLPDPRTLSRVEPSAYTNSGYDRGHLVPNLAIALCYGATAQQQTFLMSNIVPQRPKLNQETWKALEQRVLDRYTARFDGLWLLSGPVYASGWSSGSLPGGVALPSAFFLVLVDEWPDPAKPSVIGGLRSLAFLIPQDVSGSEPIPSFLTSIDEIERQTGLDLLADLPDPTEDALEKFPAPRLW